MKMDTLRFVVGTTTVDLPLLGSGTPGPFVLKSAEGLGPTEINVRLARTVLDYGLYQGKSAALRQVVALVGLEPDWSTGQTPETLRTQLYSLLTPAFGHMVRMEIVYREVVQAYVDCQASRFETALFSKDPAVQITFECAHPYFQAPNTLFQTPAQREQNTTTRAFTVDNPGTAPSGFIAGFVLRANVGTTLTLTDDHPWGQRIQIDGINWVAGDRLIIDTRPGARGIMRGPGGGALVSVLNNLNSPQSTWLELHAGANTFRLNTAAFDWDTTYKFQHVPAYLGV